MAREPKQQINSLENQKLCIDSPIHKGYFENVINLFNDLNPLPELFFGIGEASEAISLTYPHIIYDDLMATNGKSSKDWFAALSEELQLDDSMDVVEAIQFEPHNLDEPTYQNPCITSKCCTYGVNCDHNNHGCIWLDSHITAAHTLTGCTRRVKIASSSIKFDEKPDGTGTKIPMDCEAKHIARDNVSEHFTNQDYELINQGVVRVIEQFQFRAYLSKFITVSTNGWRSFVLLSQHLINESGTHRFVVNIVPIDTNQVDVFLSRVFRKVDSIGSSYYLTAEGPHILQTIQEINVKYHKSNLNIFKMRVQHVNSSVYYVTVPNESGEIPVGPYGIKVTMDNTRFYNERLMLMHYSQRENSLVSIFVRMGKRLTRLHQQQTGELPYFLFALPALSMCHSTNSKVRFENIPIVEQGGVIVMQRAIRNWDEIPEDQKNVELITTQLRKCLRHIHSCKILHTDIRPPNLMWFPHLGWQIIDFDRASFVGQIVSIQKGSDQYMR